MFKKILFFALILIVVWAFFFVSRRTRPSNTRHVLHVLALQRHLQDGARWIIIDVRGQREFNDDLGHIPHAHSVPLEILAARIQTYAAPHQAIALVCRTDSRSYQAQRILTRLGYQNVHVVRGGMQAWVEAGLTTKHE